MWYQGCPPGYGPPMMYPPQQPQSVEDLKKQLETWDQWRCSIQDTMKKKEESTKPKVRLFHPIEMFLVLVFASPFVGMFVSYWYITAAKAYVSAISAIIK